MSLYLNVSNFICNFVDECIPMYFFDAKRNFGDEVGPYLARAVRGCKTYNVRELFMSPKIAYCSAGSLLHSLGKPNCIVWGSGFIADPVVNPNKIKYNPLRISALRGPISAEFAKKLGWGECEVFGDPGLLIPKYLKFEESNSSEVITVIPHYSFAKNHSMAPSMFDVVYPWSPLEFVAEKIKASKLVISSSLHGIILADAYRVPWVWWREDNDIRKGGELKFWDFFGSLSLEEPFFVTGKFYENKASLESLVEKANLSDNIKLSNIQAGLIAAMPDFKTNAEIRNDACKA